MSSTNQTSEQALKALNQAALAIARNVTLDKVLRQIVESARELAGARYAALGIPNAEGLLEEFIHSGMPPDTVAQIGHLPHGRGLLGDILQGETLRVAKISDHPHSVGFPAGHPPMTTFLGVPIKAGETVLGNLYLTDKMGETDGVAEFSTEDEKLMEMFAAHAAVAVEKARLHDQVSRMAVVEERTRIGMDLHDGVIQDIYAVGLTLESIRLLSAGARPELLAMLDTAIAGLNDTIHDIRNFILDLRPRRFEGDLAEGLARLTREFRANAMVSVELSAPPEVIASLPPPVARTLFLSAQEALANVARHAKASHVTVAINRRNRCAVLTIADDGRGFDVGHEQQATGHGLANMYARAEDLDGTFTLQSAPGQGTTLQLEIPI